MVAIVFFIRQQLNSSPLKNIGKMLGLNEDEFLER